MGRGSRSKEESQKRSPAVNLRAATQGGELAGSEVGGVNEESPCEAPKTLNVLFMKPLTVKPEDTVKLRLGTPVAVLAQGVEVGRIQEPDASHAEACLLEGYTLIGSVQFVDPESGAGMIMVTGKKR